MKHFAFSLVVLAYLGFLGVINVLMFLPGNWMSAMGHFDFIYTGDTHNLIHELVFALVIATAAAGLASQLFKPKENFAGQLIALVVWVAMIATAALTNNWVPQPLFIIFGGLTLIATILHPAGLGLFNWIRTAKVNKVLLTLVVIAVAPLFMFAATNINLQTGGEGITIGIDIDHQGPAVHGGNPADNQELSQDMGANDEHEDQEHAAQGHYRNMAAFSFIILLVGLLASFRPRGWRLAAWVAGFLPIFLGTASIVLPNAESSIGLVWSLAAIVWGIAFIAAAELTKEPLSTPGVDKGG
ncbi:MAG TPA: hypothetical protein VGA53_00905 [Candidatus Paceibacterota bacterium]